MDVRVATVRDDSVLFESFVVNHPLNAMQPVVWEFCGDDNNYRKRCKELEAENQHLQQVANDVVAQRLLLENELYKLREDNTAMHAKITKAYQVLV
jgi:hypothetical protein